MLSPSPLMACFKAGITAHWLHHFDMPNSDAVPHSLCPPFCLQVFVYTAEACRYYRARITIVIPECICATVTH